MKSSREQRKAAILQLRLQGLSNKQIVARLSLTTGVVANAAHVLIVEGKLHPHNVAWNDLTDERVKTIVELKRSGVSLNRIAEVLKLESRQHAYQLIKKIARLHGAAIFEPRKRLYRAKAAAGKLGVSVGLIHQLCQQGKIPFSRRGRGVGGHYMFNELHLRAARQFLVSSLQFECTICHKRVTRKSLKSRRLICFSRRCRYARRVLTLHLLTPERITGWRQLVYEALRQQPILPSEKWLTFKQVMAETRLSHTQVWYLGFQRILTTCPHPSKKWRGNPIKLYAKSQIRMAAQILETWQQQQRQ